MSIEQRLATPCVAGLCPELMELFYITMGSGSLPFHRIAEERELEQEISVAPNIVEPIELARAGV